MSCPKMSHCPPMRQVGTNRDMSQNVAKCPGLSQGEGRAGGVKAETYTPLAARGRATGVNRATACQS
jgi:hypothetical protein